MADKTDPKKFSETLVILISGTAHIEKEKIDEAAKTAKNLNMSLERALVMLGHASEGSLKAVSRAHELVNDRKISVDMALKAIRFAEQNNLEVEEAIHVLASVHKKTTAVPVIGNDLTSLMMQAGMINQEQLGRAGGKAQESGLQIGRLLVLNRDVSTWMMMSAMNAQILVREGKISREDAVEALQTVGRRRISAEQALFELGLYRETPGQTVKLGEFCLMAGFMNESDMLECLEICIIKEKQFGQILLEQGHVTNAVLEAAIYLQDMVSNDTLRAYQGAEALKQVRTKGVSVYQAVAELQPPPQLTPPILTMAQLLAESGIVAKEQIANLVSVDEPSSIKVGKKVLTAGFVNEATMYTALRCYSLLREGMVSNEQAAQVLQNTHTGDGTLDDNLGKLGLILPSRMQWIWT